MRFKQEKVSFLQGITYFLSLWGRGAEYIWGISTFRVNEGGTVVAEEYKGGTIKKKKLTASEGGGWGSGVDHKNIKEPYGGIA